MRSNKLTGVQEVSTCFCGTTTVKREYETRNHWDKPTQQWVQSEAWFAFDPHNAPCGAPCIGGGVESKNGKFDHAHRSNKSCPNCIS